VARRDCSCAACRPASCGRLSATCPTRSRTPPSTRPTPGQPDSLRRRSPPTSHAFLHTPMRQTSAEAAPRSPPLPPPPPSVLGRPQRRSGSSNRERGEQSVPTGPLPGGTPAGPLGRTRRRHPARCARRAPHAQCQQLRAAGPVLLRVPGGADRALDGAGRPTPAAGRPAPRALREQRRHPTFALAGGSAAGCGAAAAWYAARTPMPLRHGTRAALLVGVLCLWPLGRFLATDWTWPRAAGAREAAPAAGPNVVLISIDTLRAD